MIEASHTVLINSPIDRVWDYARDMARWADIFPGCREFAQLDDDNSQWTIKVGVGGLVKVVQVQVHVDTWQEPARVDFSYRLAAEPVTGRGSYVAVAAGPNETELTLQVEIQGTGQMASMWESMCRPVIPRLLKSFATDFKAEAEKSAGAGVAPLAASSPQRLSLFARVRLWLRGLWAESS